MKRGRGYLRCMLASLSLLPGASDGQGSLPGTRLIVDIWPGPGIQPHRYTLECEPTGGTVRHPNRACERIAEIIPVLGSGVVLPPSTPTAPEPTPPSLPARQDGDALCTQMYSPAVARIRGHVGGVAVDWVFSGRDGCEIGQYDRAMTLLGMLP
jgi:hypothetical protein